MMDRLFIETDETGNCINHPALESNLIQVFGAVPDHWKPFNRVQPVVGIYDILESDRSTYQKRNGVWTDTWQVRPMTPSEKMMKQKSVKDAWNSRPYIRNYPHNWAAWRFDEDLCEYVPPVPRPELIEDKMVFWCGSRNNWREAPPTPDDGKSYRFNFDDWVWIESI